MDVVEISPRLYRHGKVSMQFKSRGGFSVKLNGNEVAGSTDVSKFEEVLTELLNDESVDDNTKESVKVISETASKSLYSEYILV